MTSLIYNPYTVEYEGCEDCCVGFPTVNLCPNLFPNGIARYWEFTVPAQGINSCSCYGMAGVWQLDAFSNIGNISSQGCVGCTTGSANGYIARPRTVADVINLVCNGFGGFFTFYGWRFCNGKQSQTVANFIPNIPTNSMTLSGFITSSPFNFGVAWFIEMANFNPLGTNILTRSIWTPSNTLFRCPSLPATITIEPTI